MLSDLVSRGGETRLPRPWPRCTGAQPQERGHQGGGKGGSEGAERRLYLARRAKYTFVKHVKAWPGPPADLLPIHQPVAASAEKDAAKQATGAEASAATAAEVKIIVQGIIVHEAPASSHERNAGRGRCSHVPCCVCGGTGEACQNEDTFWTVRD